MAQHADGTTLERLTDRPSSRPCRRKTLLAKAVPPGTAAAGMAPCPGRAGRTTRGEFVLLLTGGEGEPLGLFAFRRRLATGVVELVRACRTHGVDCRLLGRGPAGEEV